MAFQQQPKPFVMTHTANQWSSGICDCCDDMKSCCFAFWCFPCFACVTARNYGECLCLPLLDGSGFIPPITLSMRVSARNRYGIQGTICNDLIHSIFCGPCVWCQMAREMDTREQTVTLASRQAR
ncbi:cornifelin homolog B-like [Myxocyprinus asiaticus]|uniref:cornifelin homolog B-like n=1 Tax=Myxocyprinus asiaticus TaxID=70543 RepID=UPI00222288D6|nr:cornifelin homolog B-like [Myxocyprinus asiaticus]